MSETNLEAPVEGKASKYANLFGHHFDQHGVTPLPEKVQSILSFPIPKTLTQLRRFMGILNYYRRLIPHCAVTLAPLTDLPKSKAKPIEHSPAAHSTFEAAKKALADATSLHHLSSDPRAQLILTTDASNSAVGAARHQQVNNQLQPLVFFSQKLQPVQIHYSTFSREPLAVYLTIRHFRRLLEGRHFSVHTDHKPLTYALTAKPDRYLPREQLKQRMAQLRPTPTRQPSKRVLLHEDLKSAPFVFIRHDAVRKPLCSLYGDPFKVLQRMDKYYVTQKTDKSNTVFIDRLKPAYLECIPPPVVPPTSPAPSSPDPSGSVSSTQPAHSTTPPTHPDSPSTPPRTASRSDLFGHHFDQHGVTPLPEKVQSILSFPIPKTLTQLRRFMGILNYYRRLIPHCAVTLAPLTDLPKSKAKPIEHSPAAHSTFEAAKKALADATSLHHLSSDPRAQLILTTDASNSAVGAARHQQVNNQLQPLVFFSQKLQPVQIHYSTFSREPLAVYLTIRHFRRLLEGRHFSVHTDHKPLTYALTAKPDRYLPREQLKQRMAQLRPTPTRQPSKRVLLHEDLKSAPFVFIRHDAVRKPLCSLYGDPFKVLQRMDKYYVTQKTDKSNTVFIDRLKPAYLECIPPPVVPPTSPAPSSPDPSGSVSSTQPAHSTTPPTHPDSPSTPPRTASRSDLFGHHFDQHGVTPLPEKVQSILSFPIPKTLTQLRRFMGILNYYRRLIPHCAVTLAPLTDLPKSKAKPIEHSPAAHSTFEAAKKALADATSLHHLSSDPRAQLILTTDASNSAVGAARHQQVNNQLQPLVFFSQKLQPVQIHYSTFSREPLAVYLTIRHFRRLLEGRHFSVHTDHKPLTYALTAKPDRYLPREQLKQRMAQLRPTPTRQPSKRVLLHEDLKSAPFVFIRHDAVRKPLCSLYGDPFKVLQRMDKYYVTQKTDKSNTVFIDRLKPAYLECIPPPVVPPTSPAPSSPDPSGSVSSTQPAHSTTPPTHPDSPSTPPRTASRSDLFGHHFDQHGVTPLPEKVQSILSFPIPKTLTQLRRFMGILNYYRRLIPHCAVTLAPLTDLPKSKAKPIEHSPAAHSTFEAAKKALADATSLHHLSSDPRAQLILTTDASNSAVGAARHQQVNNQLQPLVFFSQKLQPVQIHYSTFSREPLAVYLTIRHFRRLLEGRHFSVHTDHKPLTYALTAKPDRYLPREQLKQRMAQLRPTPTRQPSKRVLLHEDLKSAPFVFIRHDAVRKPLCSLYGDPFKVLQRMDKYYVTQKTDKSNTVFIDRLKPAYLECIPPPVVPPTSPAPSSPDPSGSVSSTQPAHSTTPPTHPDSPSTPPRTASRSGRHSHFPAKLKDFLEKNLSTVNAYSYYSYASSNSAFALNSTASANSYTASSSSATSSAYFPPHSRPHPPQPRFLPLHSHTQPAHPQSPPTLTHSRLPILHPHFRPPHTQFPTPRIPPLHPRLPSPPPRYPHLLLRIRILIHRNCILVICIRILLLRCIRFLNDAFAFSSNTSAYSYKASYSSASACSTCAYAFSSAPTASSPHPHPPPTPHPHPPIPYPHFHKPFFRVLQLRIRIYLHGIRKFLHSVFLLHICIFLHRIRIFSSASTASSKITSCSSTASANSYTAFSFSATTSFSSISCSCSCSCSSSSSSSSSSVTASKHPHPHTHPQQPHFRHLHPHPQPVKSHPSPPTNPQTQTPHLHFPPPHPQITTPRPPSPHSLIPPPYPYFPSPHPQKFIDRKRILLRSFKYPQFPAELLPPPNTHLPLRIHILLFRICIFLHRIRLFSSSFTASSTASEISSTAYSSSKSIFTTYHPSFSSASSHSHPHPRPPQPHFAPLHPYPHSGHSHPPPPTHLHPPPPHPHFSPPQPHHLLRIGILLHRVRMFLHFIRKLIHRVFLLRIHILIRRNRIFVICIRILNLRNRIHFPRRIRILHRRICIFLHGFLKFLQIVLLRIRIFSSASSSPDTPVSSYSALAFSSTAYASSPLHRQTPPQHSLVPPPHPQIPSRRILLLILNFSFASPSTSTAF
ncbi:hypothetical protein SprV_0301124700 [Sparganum proliferum]